MLQRIETAVRSLHRVLSRSWWLTWIFQLEPAPVTDEDGGDPTSSGRYRAGLVMVQIDGLGKAALEKALSRSEMPFLSRLIKREHYELLDLYSGLPSSTPAVQAELFYGLKTAVPAFSFRNHKSGKHEVMYAPESAARVQRRLEQHAVGLLDGGSAYCDIYTGGAAESHFCASSSGIDDILRNGKPVSWVLASLLSLPLLLRCFVLLGVEFAIGLIDLFRGLIRGYRPFPEFKFVLSRVIVSVLLRDLVTIGAKMDIERGLPVIHLNFLGYDEQAHRRGPHSAFAHWALRGIDQRIATLWRACHNARYRHYDLWIYSDHGQEPVIPYERLTGETLLQAVERVTGLECRAAAIPTSRPLDRSQLLINGKALASQPPDGFTSSHCRGSATVIAMGPVGFVYLRASDHDRSTTESAPALAQASSDTPYYAWDLDIFARQLCQCASVPAVLFRDSVSGEIRGYNGQQPLRWPRDARRLLGHSHPHYESVLADIEGLLTHPDAGELVLLGWAAGQRSVSFPVENGSHAGIGPQETAAFALLPDDLLKVAENPVGIRPLDLRHAALRVLQTQAHIETPVQGGRKLPKHPGDCLRLMTYNVHGCIGMDGRVAPERIARVIARYRPDIVALQELDVARPRSHHADQAACIARLLEMDVQFHPVISREQERYGDAIFSALPLKLQQAVELPGFSGNPQAEPRGALWVRVAFNGQWVNIVNTHLGLSATERLVQAKALAGEQWMQHADCVGPRILCGDLNMTADSKAFRVLTTQLKDVQTVAMASLGAEGVAAGQDDGRRASTFASRFPVLRIDHVLVSDECRVCQVVVPNTALTRVASDHFPLIVDLKFD